MYAKAALGPAPLLKEVGLQDISTRGVATEHHNSLMMPPPVQCHSRSADEKPGGVALLWPELTGGAWHLRLDHIAKIPFPSFAGYVHVRPTKYGPWW